MKDLTLAEFMGAHGDHQETVESGKTVFLFQDGARAVFTHGKSCVPVLCEPNDDDLTTLQGRRDFLAQRLQEIERCFNDVRLCLAGRWHQGVTVSGPSAGFDPWRQCFPNDAMPANPHKPGMPVQATLQECKLRGDAVRNALAEVNQRIENHPAYLQQRAEQESELQKREQLLQGAWTRARQESDRIMQIGFSD